MILRGMVLSKFLAMETGITVITPDTVTKEAPDCCYLLHGAYGNHENWATYSRLPVYARERNTVFVMPEAGRSFYADMRYGQKYFRYVADELPRFVEKTFHIRTGRENTCIMGASMGGNGAIRIALRRPERFGRCCAFGSAALFLKQFMDGIDKPDKTAALEGMLGKQLTEDFRAILGDDFHVPPEFDIPALAEELASAPVKPKFYSACGADDAMFRGENAAFAERMRALGYDYVHEELPGGHDFAFFDSALGRALERF
jgi:S-formylglutathione hydrolase FrmB